MALVNRGFGENDMTVRMYVITHKKADIVKIPGYIPLLVGADLHPDIDQSGVKDNNGENISSKNPNYCELTGIYWIWKNAMDDIVGILHYRRYFSKSRLSSKHQYFISSSDIERIMRKKRIILPKARPLSTTVLQAINRAPNINDVKEMYAAIKILEPRYIDDYIWYLNQNKAHLYNMAIMRRSDFCNYCDWLFRILSYIEDHHDMDAETDIYRKRLYGFLSERLITVWMHHNIVNSDIVEIPVVNTEESTVSRLRHIVGDIVRNCQYIMTARTKKSAEKQSSMMRTVLDEL